MEKEMKSLIQVINEKLKISSKSKIDNEFEIKNSKVEIHNEVDCKALPKEYINAIIKAFLSSTLKNDVISINVTDAKTYFETDPEGQKTIKYNRINYKFLNNDAYPALTVTWKPKNGKVPRLDTIRGRLPYIHMPFILSDDNGLFTKRNSYNALGMWDVECVTTGFHIDRYRPNWDDIEYKYTIIYFIRPNATKKLIPIYEFYNNLLGYYKCKVSEISTYLKKFEDKFYTDDKRDKNGWLELDKQREEECEKHMHVTW